MIWLFLPNLTIDCDVFDPSLFPAVNYPVPNGWFYKDFLEVIHPLLPKINLIGIDIVEYNSNKDSNGIAANVVSNMVLDILSVIGGKYGRN